MPALYLASVWLHLLAVITWLGGSMFLVLVAVPWLRRGDRALAARFLRETGPRLRALGWICFAIMAVTGGYNLWVRGVGLTSFADPAWRASPFGQAALAKLALFELGGVGLAVLDLAVHALDQAAVLLEALAAVSRSPALR